MKGRTLRSPLVPHRDQALRIFDYGDVIVLVYDPGEGTAAPSHCGRGDTHVPHGGLGIVPVGDSRSDGDDAEGEQLRV